MTSIRDIVKEVFAVVSELRTAAVGPLPTTGGASEVAALLDAKPLTLDGGKPGSVSTSRERDLIAKRLFDQWRAAAPPAQATLTIQIKAGDGQILAAGAVVDPLSVAVFDDGGRAVANVPVFFFVKSGNGSVRGPRQATDASGIAVMSDKKLSEWRLGDDPGPNELVARLGNGKEVTFTATGRGGPSGGGGGTGVKGARSSGGTGTPALAP
jgi:hypothetical protein